MLLIWGVFVFLVRSRRFVEWLYWERRTIHHSRRWSMTQITAPMKPPLHSRLTAMRRKFNRLSYLRLDFFFFWVRLSIFYLFKLLILILVRIRKMGGRIFSHISVLAFWCPLHTSIQGIVRTENSLSFCICVNANSFAQLLLASSCQQLSRIYRQELSISMR